MSSDESMWEDCSLLLRPGIRRGAEFGWVYRVSGIYEDPCRPPDDNERLLYIGQTRCSLLSRMNGHAFASLFWLRATRIEARPVSSDELDAVEYAEIHEHHPPFNRMCWGWCDHYRQVAA